MVARGSLLSRTLRRMREDVWMLLREDTKALIEGLPAGESRRILSRISSNLVEGEALQLAADLVVFTDHSATQAQTTSPSELETAAAHETKAAPRETEADLIHGDVPPIPDGVIPVSVTQRRSRMPLPQVIEAPEAAPVPVAADQEQTRQSLQNLFVDADPDVTAETPQTGEPATEVQDAPKRRFPFSNPLGKLGGLFKRGENGGGQGREELGQIFAEEQEGGNGRRGLPRSLNLPKATEIFNPAPMRMLVVILAGIAVLYIVGRFVLPMLPNGGFPTSETWYTQPAAPSGTLPPTFGVPSDIPTFFKNIPSYLPWVGWWMQAVILFVMLVAERRNANEPQDIKVVGWSLCGFLVVLFLGPVVNVLVRLLISKLGASWTVDDATLTGIAGFVALMIIFTAAMTGKFDLTPFSIGTYLMGMFVIGMFPEDGPGYFIGRGLILAGLGVELTEITRRYKKHGEEVIKSIVIVVFSIAVFWVFRPLLVQFYSGPSFSLLQALMPVKTAGYITAFVLSWASAVVLSSVFLNTGRSAMVDPEGRTEGKIATIGPEFLWDVPILTLMSAITIGILLGM